MDKKLLSLCVPIYNRKEYLKKMLNRFSEDKDLFIKSIELIISDNCSEDDLRSVVDTYAQQGLNLSYYRQVSNIGSDANFLFCFGKATGKYCWLLGSDDIPVCGFLKYLINELDKDEDYGLVYLQLYQFTRWFSREKTDKVYSNVILDNQKMISDISVWITFMSSSIVRTECIDSINLSKYLGTSLIQVPLYIKSCLSSEKNLVITYNYCFEPDNDNASSGGYNFYRVFVDNLFSILGDFVNQGLMTEVAYNRFKRKEYDFFLIRNTKSIFLNKRDKIHKVEGAWSILLKHYGMHLYTYYDIIRFILVRSIAKIIGK